MPLDEEDCCYGAHGLAPLQHYALLKSRTPPALDEPECPYDSSDNADELAPSAVIHTRFRSAAFNIS
jgi:hypothetical protein